MLVWRVFIPNSYSVILLMHATCKLIILIFLPEPSTLSSSFSGRGSTVTSDMTDASPKVPLRFISINKTGPTTKLGLATLICL